MTFELKPGQVIISGDEEAREQVKALQIAILELVGNASAHIVASTLLDLLSTVLVATVKDGLAEELHAGVVTELKRALAEKLATKRFAELPTTSLEKN